jgi:hypothetical protein
MPKKIEAIGPESIPQIDQFLGLQLKATRRMRDGFALCFCSSIEDTSGKAMMVQMHIEEGMARMKIANGTWQDKEEVITASG